MKKFALSILVILIALTMVACTNKSTKALNSLEEQLDNVEQVVSSTSTSEVSDVSPAIIYNSTNTSTDIQNHKALSYTNMTREEDVRQNVLAINSYLKSNIQTDLKLSQAQINTIKSINSDLSKYLKKLKSTKTDVKSNINSLKKNLKTTSKETTEIEKDYINLNNIMNERYSYLTSIYSDLDLAYKIVCKNKVNSNDTIFYDFRQPSNEIETNSESKFTIKKNIDSYNTISNNEDKKSENAENNSNNSQYRSYYEPYYMPYNYYNPYMNGYNYGRFNNFYNNGYGYNNYFNNQFNPGRNTDTFYSLNRNIDSYRFNPHFNGIMANTQYLQRIEDDNTIQNNTEKDCCQDKNSEKSSENLNKDFSEKINDIKEQSSFDNNLLDEKNA